MMLKQIKLNRFMNSNEPKILTRDVEARSCPSARRSRCKRADRLTSRNRSAARSPSSSTATCSALTARTPTRSGWKSKPRRPRPFPAPVTQEQLEKQIWEALKTCYDPEIPVNIVDLGLIYDCHLTPVGENNFKADVKMTLTAPGCGMGPVLAQDVQNKLISLEPIDEANVELVWDPPWNQGMMTEAAKLQLGLM